MGKRSQYLVDFSPANFSRGALPNRFKPAGFDIDALGRLIPIASRPGVGIHPNKPTHLNRRCTVRQAVWLGMNWLSVVASEFCPQLLYPRRSSVRHRPCKRGAATTQSWQCRHSGHHRHYRRHRLRGRSIGRRPRSQIAPDERHDHSLCGLAAYFVAALATNTRLPTLGVTFGDS